MCSGPRRSSRAPSFRERGFGSIGGVRSFGRRLAAVEREMMAEVERIVSVVIPT
jgi:hypothetical protein